MGAVFCQTGTRFYYLGCGTNVCGSQYEYEEAMVWICGPAGRGRRLDLAMCSFIHKRIVRLPCRPAGRPIWPVMSDMQSQNDIEQSTADGTFNQTALVDLTITENIPYYAGTTVPNWMTAYATASQEFFPHATRGSANPDLLDYSTSQTYEGSEIRFGPIELIP